MAYAVKHAQFRFLASYTVSSIFFTNFDLKTIALTPKTKIHRNTAILQKKKT